MKELEIPTSNLPPYMKNYINIDKHPYSNVVIEEIDKNKAKITITPSDKKFYD